MRENCWACDGRVPDAVQRECEARSGAPLIRDPVAFHRRKPGSRVCSASFRHSASKTRVHALMAHAALRPGHAVGHSAFTLASRITLRHFGSSDLMYLVRCSGGPAIDSKYCRSRKFFLISGSARVLRTSPLILATMSGAIPGGPNSPNQ